MTSMVDFLLLSRAKRIKYDTEQLHNAAMHYKILSCVLPCMVTFGPAVTVNKYHISINVLLLLLLCTSYTVCYLLGW